MDSLKTVFKSFRNNESAISTFLGALVILITGVLLINYFRSSRSAEPTISEEAESTVAVSGDIELVELEEGKLAPKGLPTAHTVAVGDHLWSISEKYYGNGYNWTDIAEANGLSDADSIEVGMSLTIPQAALRYTGDVMTSADKDLLEATSYTVQAGDNLWDIATRAYGDGYQWVRISEANQSLLNNPDLLEIDMVLTLPR